MGVIRPGAFTGLQANDSVAELIASPKSIWNLSGNESGPNRGGGIAIRPCSGQV